MWVNIGLIAHTVALIKMHSPQTKYRPHASDTLDRVFMINRADLTKGLLTFIHKCNSGHVTIVMMEKCVCVCVCVCVRARACVCVCVCFKIKWEFFFIFFKFLEDIGPFVGPLIPTSGHIYTCFKAEVDSSLVCFSACMQWIPQIHLWCNTCWALCSNHGS